jgi:ABC-type sugar transport system substrate-binding protein
MKKLTSLLLAFCLLFTIAALAACGPAEPTDDRPEYVEQEKDVTKEWPDEPGFFDPTYDYSVKGAEFAKDGEKLQIGYIVSAANFLYDEFDRAFRSWASRMNIEYTGMYVPTGASIDEILSTIETYAAQGYDGVLLDVDSNSYLTVSEKCDSVGLPWISCMSQPRNAGATYAYGDTFVNGELLGSSAGFDNYQVGRWMIDKLESWRLENYPDVPLDRVKVIATDFSLAAPLHERVLGAEMAWADIHPEFGAYNPSNQSNPSNFIITDLAGIDQASAQTGVTQMLTEHASTTDVWLIYGLFDDLAIGSANAIEAQGFDDNACVVTFGGSSLIEQWDSGIESSARYAMFTAQTIMAEPLINALWAYITEWKTPETIWPDWTVVWDKGDVFELSAEDDLNPLYQARKVVAGPDGKPVVLKESNYAYLRLLPEWIDVTNYKLYTEWTDLYAYGPDASGLYGYEPVTDLDMYESRATPPAEYKEYPSLG